MERTENLDLWISKMADPALMNELCLAYKKKRSFKYKDKANIHYNGDNSKRPFFNETEECLKLLKFLGKESVNNPNNKQELVDKSFKESDSEEEVKNCINVARKSCQITDSVNTQGQDTNFSKKPRKIKSNVNNVVMLSSDSSEDEIELIPKYTINEYNANPPSRIINDTKSCVENKSQEVSIGLVASKSNIMAESVQNSHENKLSKRKGQEHSAISDTEEVYSDKQGIKKKSTDRNKLCSTQAPKNNLLKPCIIKPHPGSVSYVEQDIITISSDSSTDSDEDIFEKVYYKGTEKKFKVQKSESKNFTTHAKFVSENKSQDISEPITISQVSLLDPHIFPKSGPNKTVKGHTSCKIPSVKNRFISEQNNRGNNVKELEKSTPIFRNSVQDVTGRKTNLKMIGNKAFLPTKTADKSDYSLITNHSGNLSNVSYNSNVTAVESDSSSDEVLFQGVYKNYDASNEEYKSNKIICQSGVSFVKQSKDLENSEKAHTVYNTVLEDKNALSNSLFSSVDSCIKNNEDLEEIYIENNFGKEMVNEELILSQQNDLMKKKFDFVPEPVDFEIPVLHQKESVAMPKKEDYARWTTQGVKIKQGRWTPEEDEILKKNFIEFSTVYGISDPCMIFGIHSDHKNDASIRRFLRAKHFYARLGKNLDDRTLVSIYYRARLIFHPYASNKKWTSEDYLKLKHLYKMFGSNWSKIGQILKKPGDYCHAYFKNVVESRGL